MVTKTSEVEEGLSSKLEKEEDGEKEKKKMEEEKKEKEEKEEEEEIPGDVIKVLRLALPEVEKAQTWRGLQLEVALVSGRWEVDGRWVGGGWKVGGRW